MEELSVILVAAFMLVLFAISLVGLFGMMIARARASRTKKAAIRGQPRAK